MRAPGTAATILLSEVCPPNPFDVEKSHPGVDDCGRHERPSPAINRRLAIF